MLNMMYSLLISFTFLYFYLYIYNSFGFFFLISFTILANIACAKLTIALFVNGMMVINDHIH